MVESVTPSGTHTEFDLAIIGGGIIGMCTAWYAAQQFPQWRIAVLEQNTIGSGATQHSASLDLPYGHTPLRHHLATRSQALYPVLRQTLPLPIQDVTFYGIAAGEQAEKIVSGFVGERSPVAPENTALVLANSPGLLLPAGKIMVATGTASYAVQNEVAAIIAGNWRSHIHTIFEHTAIQSVHRSEQHFTLNTMAGTAVSAKKVVQATGPWLARLLVGTQSPMPTIRVKKIVAFHIMQPPRADDALLYFFDDDAFLLPKYEAGYWLFSFKCDHWDVLPDSHHLTISDADITKARSILTKYYPSFKPLCHAGRVFCDAYTPTGDPVIAPLHGSNYIFAGAGAGSGYRLAPGIAEAAISYFNGSV